MEGKLLSYRELCDKIKVETIQRGMNFRIKKGLSIILMSVRPKAPYSDAIDYENNLLIYEGHDIPKSKEHPNPKTLDQPIWNKNGSLTENGKFIKAVEDYKKGFIPPEKVLVFEKLKKGEWIEKGIFLLIDYEVRNSGGRKVFKFILKPSNEEIVVSNEKNENNKKVENKK